MTGKNALNDMDVIICLSDEKERELASELMKSAGASDVMFAENTLEMMLLALKSEIFVLITEAEAGVLDLPSSLDYITKNSKYGTISVIADSWPEEGRDGLIGSVDVFLTRPLVERNLVPGIMVNAARKRHMRELERELQESEDSFAKDKNMSFAEHVIMDTLGLSKEGAGEYIKALAEKHGYDDGEVANIVYEALLAGRKQ